MAIVPWDTERPCRNLPPNRLQKPHLSHHSYFCSAACVEIKLKEHGLEKIEVIDNGSGVDRSNYQNLTLKHYTSKLREFSDLNAVVCSCGEKARSRSLSPSLPLSLPLSPCMRAASPRANVLLPSASSLVTDQSGRSLFTAGVGLRSGTVYYV